MKILIIKLAAIGDVLRTTSILPVLKKKYPGSHITWLTEEPSIPLLEINSFIDRLLPNNPIIRKQLEKESFNLILSLDEDPEGAALATLIQAETKKGFGFNKTNGTLYTLNKEAEYAFRLRTDDDLKFRKNQKTYQEIIFELIGLPYHKEKYVLNLPEEDKAYAHSLFQKYEINDKDLVIGLNTGAGPVFATKKWSAAGFAALAGKLHKKLGAHIFLLGGKSEKKINESLVRQVQAPIIDTGTDNTLLQFAAIISNCSLIVTGDTLGMHLAIARNVPVTAIFGSTCAQEIDLYGKGKKIVSRVDCAPCYRHNCPEMLCMEKITPEEVFLAVKEAVETGKVI